MVAGFVHNLTAYPNSAMNGRGNFTLFFGVDNEGRAQGIPVEEYHLVGPQSTPLKTLLFMKMINWRCLRTLQKCVFTNLTLSKSIINYNVPLIMSDF